MIARRWIRRGALVGIVVGSACDVPSLPDRSVVALRNTCVDDSGCPGGVCASEGVCYATTSTIGKIVLALTAADGADTPTFIDQPITSAALAASGGRLSGSLLARQPVELSITPRFAIGATSITGCQWKTSPGGIVGARAAVLPSGSIRGLPTRPLFATAAPYPPSSDPPELWQLGLLVPPSSQDLRYDVYLTALDDADCPVPPLLLRGVAVQDQRLTLAVGLEPPRSLIGTVSVPSGGSFLGYRVEIVDGATGLLTSTVGIVGSVGEDGRATFGVNREGVFVPIEYYSVAGAPKPILRFVPPEGTVAPTLLWDVAAIDITGSGVVALDVGDLATRAISLEGRVERESASIGTAAQIFFRSRTRGVVGAPAGVPAFFATTAATTVDGVFRVKLLAGEYDVTAVPVSDATLTLARQSVQLASQPATQAGRLLQFPARPLVNTRVLSRGEQPLAGVEVTVAPAARAPSYDSFEIARRDVALAVSGQTGLTNADGFVALPTDATSAVLTAKVGRATRFPWIVQTGVTPSPTEVALEPSSPIELSGSARDERGALPFAVIRAYARLPAATDDGDYVQIGEAVADATGRYELLLPSRFGPLSGHRTSLSAHRALAHTAARREDAPADTDSGRLPFRSCRDPEGGQPPQPKRRRCPRQTISRGCSTTSPTRSPS